MNVYEYELAGFAQSIQDQPVREDPHEIEWDDNFIPVELAVCEEPF